MSNSKLSDITDHIKSMSYDFGFSFCGISKAGFLEKQAPLFEEWLNNNHHGKMGYMENHFDKRLDTTKLVPGAKSVISLMYNYYPSVVLPQDDNLKISKYAYSKDYHFVVKEKLDLFFNSIKEYYGNIEGRYFVDSAPVMDKAWAEKSGLGWIGKNTNIITKKQGSFFFIAELIIDFELSYDGPIKDYCGTCTKCIEACPTDALSVPYQIDGSKCISYFTIELKEDIPSGYDFKDWMFGCDICQDVCPWNRFSKPHNEPSFLPSNDLLDMTKKSWENLDHPTFNKLFKKSPVKRTKFTGLKRNIDYVIKK
jgi:epoxyqueuosine reductase